MDILFNYRWLVLTDVKNNVVKHIICLLVQIFVQFQIDISQYTSYHTYQKIKCDNRNGKQVKLYTFNSNMLSFILLELWVSMRHFFKHL